MQLQAQIHGFSSSMRGTALNSRSAGSARASAARLDVQAATQKMATRRLKQGEKAPKPLPPPPRKGAMASPTRNLPGTVKIGGMGTGTRRIGGTGTKKAGSVKSIEVFSKDSTLRAKQAAGARPAPKVLSRIQQLRLLSKLEQSGLLSLAERQGLTLSALEKSGLLSKAEGLGFISLLGDRNFPGTLYTLAALLLAAGPAAVYFLPDDSGALVALQAAVALVCIAGGSAAWGGATLLSTLQKS